MARDLTLGIVTDLHFGPEARWQGKQRVRPVHKLRELLYGRVLQRPVLHPAHVRQRERRRARDKLRSRVIGVRDHQVVRALRSRRSVLQPQVHRVRSEDVRGLCSPELRSR